jgi:DNA-directed RNA polymerase specialized sigma24 family protein
MRIRLQSPIVRAVDYTNVVQLLRSDPNAGVLAVAEQYGNALYDYSYTMLGDHGEAANALHDVLLVASVRVRELRRPADLERWLYALVRNEANRRQSAGISSALRQESHWRPVNELDHAVMALDARAPGILDLVLRHGLGPVDVSAILGVSARRGQELVTQARALADNSSATSPYFEMPASLPERVVESLTNPDRAAVVAELAGAFDRTGFPAPERRRRRPLLVMAAGIAVLVLATGGGIALTDDPAREDQPQAIGDAAVPGGDRESPGVGPSESSTSSAPAASSSGSPSPTTTVSTTVSPSLTSSAPPSLPPSSSSQPVPPPQVPSATVSPLGVTTTVAKRGKECGKSWKATVVAKVTGGTAKQVTISWWWPGESRHTRSGAPGVGGRYKVDVDGLPYDTVVYFKATAVTANGRHGESDTVTQKWPSCKGGDDD